MSELRVETRPPRREAPQVDPILVHSELVVSIQKLADGSRLLEVVVDGKAEAWLVPEGVPAKVWLHGNTIVGLGGETLSEILRSAEKEPA